MAEIVVVCTATICRSPMAEALLRAWFERHGAAEQVTVSSAGVRARDGHRAAPVLATALGVGEGRTR